MSEKLDKIRVGNFTSSGIVDLLSNGRSKGTFGKPFYNYVARKNRERLIDDTMDSESRARPLLWGKICEAYAQKHHSDMKWTYQSDLEKMFGSATAPHPKYDYWCGTPDVIDVANEIVGDFKCPWTKSGFLDLIECMYDPVTKKRNSLSGNEIIEIIRKETKEGEKYYWQLVSNACILGYNKAAILVFFANSEVINELPLFANNDFHPPVDFLKWMEIDELPYVKKELDMPLIHEIMFDIPKEDKKKLEERVVEGGKLLIPRRNNN